MYVKETIFVRVSFIGIWESYIVRKMALFVYSIDQNPEALRD